MIGAQRPTVTVAVGTLEAAGLIQHRRGAISIVDPAGLEQASCECYEVARKRHGLSAPSESVSKLTDRS